MTNLFLLVCGLLGVISHCLIKAQSLKTDATKANLSWKFEDYIKNDYLGILLSFVSVLAWLLLFEEVATKYGALANFARVSFFVMGLVGSYLIQTVLSRAKKQIRETVDRKTDALDVLKKEKDENAD